MTLCVISVFAVVRCLSVCRSVRLSVTFVYCIQKAGDIVKLFSRPGSPILLVFFWIQAPVTIARRTPSAGVQNTRGGKNCDFRLKSPFISRERYEIGPNCYGPLIWSHRRRIDPCRFRWPWVTSKGGTRGIKFSGGSP